MRRWQDRLDPIWKRLAGGCHINREVPKAIEAAGFRIGSGGTETIAIVEGATTAELDNSDNFFFL